MVKHKIELNEFLFLRKEKEMKKKEKKTIHIPSANFSNLTPSQGQVKPHYGHSLRACSAGGKKVGKKN
jgi:hypothetical protein